MHNICCWSYLDTKSTIRVILKENLKFKKAEASKAYRDRKKHKEILEKRATSLTTIRTKIKQKNSGSTTIPKLKNAWRNIKKGRSKAWIGRKLQTKSQILVRKLRKLLSFMLTRLLSSGNIELRCLQGCRLPQELLYSGKNGKAKRTREDCKTETGG